MVESIEALLQEAVSLGLDANRDSGYRVRDWPGPDKSRQAALDLLAQRARAVRERLIPEPPGPSILYDITLFADDATVARAEVEATGKREAQQKMFDDHWDPRLDSASCSPRYFLHGTREIERKAKAAP